MQNNIQPKFNNTNRHIILAQRFQAFAREHGVAHIEMLGGKDVVMDMLQADIDLARSERLQPDFLENIKNRLRERYRESVPGLYASGFFDDSLKA